jgi:hypothetical protein
MYLTCRSESSTATISITDLCLAQAYVLKTMGKSQSYGLELQRQRCKNFQRRE